MDDRSTMSDVSVDDLSSVTSVSSLDSSFDTFNSSWSESDCTSMDEQFHVDDSGVDDRDPLQQPLYDGADISVSDSHALLLLYFLRHGLTKKAQSELLQLIELHLPQSAKTAGSLYKLKKLFKGIFSDVQADAHRFCDGCYGPLQPGESCEDRRCQGAKVKKFVMAPIAAQLKRKAEGMYKSKCYIALLPGSTSQLFSRVILICAKKARQKSLGTRLNVT